MSAWILALALLAQQDLEKNLAAARAAYEADPHDADKTIWLGRRLGYLGRFDEAIAAFSKGIEEHPDNAKLYRHRGHRYISTFQFDKAISDFNRAAKLTAKQDDEIEPDGRPNKINKPLSTLKFNIYYHLGLAHYLKGDFRKALDAYRECMKYSRNNDDSLVATSDWLYMTHRRLGQKKEAAQVLTAIHDKMEIIENDSYYKRLRMYQGKLRPEQLLDERKADDLTIATQGYGVANWYLYNGQREKAVALLEKIVTGKQPAAFGTIAAKSDLMRLKGAW
jgi:tetratricopeptide (TPR) repeat protein